MDNREDLFAQVRGRFAALRLRITDYMDMRHEGAISWTIKEVVQGIGSNEMAVEAALLDLTLDGLVEFDGKGYSRS